MWYPKNLEELEKLLQKRYFGPERRLYERLKVSRSRFNRRRYLRALIRKLQKKGVIVTPWLVEEIIRSLPPEKD